MTFLRWGPVCRGMQLLFVVPYAPTPIRVRPYNLIKSLVARGHRLTLATLWTDQAEREGLRQLEALGVRVIAERLPRHRSLLNCLRALPTPVPLQAVYCRVPGLRERIHEELDGSPRRRYDVVHVEHLRGAQYGLGLEGGPVVWDSVDCISYLFEQSARDSQSLSGRLMSRLDLGRTRRYEGWLVGQFDRVLVTSRADQQALEKLSPQRAQRSQSHKTTVSESSASSALSAVNESRITVLPNGVDLDYFTPSGDERQADSIVISGKMSYHANVTAVRSLVDEIMPLVWAQRPGVKVTVAGAYPPRQIRQLAQRFPGRVEVTGTVPDMRPYLRRATAAVAPVPYGAGIQNKVLEAMACGTPVVATPQACAALAVVPGQDLLVAAEPEEFARQVLRVLADRELAGRLSAAGRRYVEAHHNWHSIAGQLEDIYAEVIDQFRVRGSVHSRSSRVVAGA